MNKYLLMLFSLLILGFSACRDKWEDHTELSEAVLNESLLLQIQANPNLRKFDEYLRQTGYDQLLQSSKTFTVWAPTNQALAGLDPAVTSDPVRLKNFIANHISYQRYFTAQGSTRIKMLSGKYLSWGGNQLDGVAVEAPSANRYSGNGVVHVLTAAVVPRPNIYEVVMNTPLAAKQAAYIKSKNDSVFVADRAEIERIDPATGEPVYKAGTGYFPVNTFFNRTQDLQREDSLYTQILLTDAAFDAEYNKISRFFTHQADTMADVTSFHLIKDLVFKGLITPENLPDTLDSAFGVRVPIDKSAIVQTIRTSNGIVYVMNKVDFRLTNKVPPIVIEGESAIGYRESRPDNTHRRYRAWASNLLDIRVTGHGVSGFYNIYRAQNVYAAKYKVYWRAVNDFYVEATRNNTFRQRLAVGLPVNHVFPFMYPFVDLPLTTNPAGVGELYLGEYTFDRLGTRYFGLLADGTYPLELDYIKLVPVY